MGVLWQNKITWRYVQRNSCEHEKQQAEINKHKKAPTDKQRELEVLLAK